MGNYTRVLVRPGATIFWEGGTVGQVFYAPKHDFLNYICCANEIYDIRFVGVLHAIISVPPKPDKIILNMK